ncbi:COX3 domain-containing protein, variant 2 [Balamuthia mandrillaris]
MFGRNVQRTSDSHALVVDFIPVEDAEHGRLGMSFAPGKHQQRALYGPWKRDLDKDLNVLLGTYDVDVLVTLLPQEECEELAIPKLLRKVKARRIESIHYPIQLGTIPKEKDYPQLLALVRRIVDLWREQHKTVIVHCRQRRASKNRDGSLWMLYCRIGRHRRGGHQADKKGSRGRHSSERPAGLCSPLSLFLQEATPLILRGITTNQFTL